MKYIYPPRPENKIPRANLNKFDNGEFMAEPKFNGSCCEIYVDEPISVMNRHNESLSNFKIKDDEIMDILNIGEGKNVFCGEYMNKSKKDKNGNIFNHKFVIFDIIVLNDVHLLGTTFIERYEMLKKMFNFIDEDEFTYKITDNLFLTKMYEDNFCELWDEFIKTDMIEGFVLKRKNAKLEPGVREKNNTLSQIKCRKETKNYSY